MKYFRKITASLLMCTAVSAYASMDLAEAIAQSVSSGNITKVSVEPIPHDDAMMLTIKTTTKQYNVIVAKEYVDAALAMLSNPQVVAAATNAATDYARHNPVVMAKLVAPTHQIAHAVPASQLPSTTPPQLTHASATIAVAATAANQQASK